MLSETPQQYDSQIQWLTEGLHVGGVITKYIDQHSIIDREDLVRNLYRDIRGGVCTSTTKKQLNRWAKLRVQRHAERLRPFHLIEELKKKNGRAPTLEEVRVLLFSHNLIGNGQATNFPPYEIRDHVAYVTLPSGNVLKVSAREGSKDVRDNFFEILLWLWPFREVDGCLVKQTVRQTHRGRWVPSTVSINKLFAELTYRDLKFSSTRAVNGNFLDLTNGNIQPIAHNPKGRLTRNEIEFNVNKSVRETRKFELWHCTHRKNAPGPIPYRVLKHWESSFVPQTRGELAQREFDSNLLELATGANGEQIEPEGYDPERPEEIN